jgi:hypothetical protein
VIGAFRSGQRQFWESGSNNIKIWTAGVTKTHVKRFLICNISRGNVNRLCLPTRGMLRSTTCKRLRPLDTIRSGVDYHLTLVQQKTADTGISSFGKEVSWTRPGAIVDYAGRGGKKDSTRGDNANTYGQTIGREQHPQGENIRVSECQRGRLASGGSHK